MAKLYLIQDTTLDAILTLAEDDGAKSNLVLTLQQELANAQTQEGNPIPEDIAARIAALSTPSTNSTLTNMTTGVVSPGPGAAPVAPTGAAVLSGGVAGVDPSVPGTTVIPGTQPAAGPSSGIALGGGAPGASPATPPPAAPAAPAAPATPPPPTPGVSPAAPPADGQ